MTRELLTLLNDYRTNCEAWARSGDEQHLIALTENEAALARMLAWNRRAPVSSSLDETTSPDGPHPDQMRRLWSLMRGFVVAHEITCGETIYQTDKVAEHSLDLILLMTEVVGYYEYPEDVK
ncbi:MAG: hypothetical protein JWM95_1722 [Gemmatimonadetes bacterium]|nr:hypothetical protein [Gemmatimonadota bacterium]